MVRFERALSELDIRAAVQFAPEACRGAVSQMAAALAGKEPEEANLSQLVDARLPNWPAALETAWHQLVGRRLDMGKTGRLPKSGRPIPGKLNGEFAAEFHLRGGDSARAEKSIWRNIDHDPRDGAAWSVLARMQPLPAAARAAFHGGNPPLAGLDSVLGAIDADEQLPVLPWILPYAWLVRQIATADLTAALDAEGVTARPIPMANNAVAFTFYLVEAEGIRMSADGISGTVVDARRRLKLISPLAFKRYLAFSSG